MVVDSKQEFFYYVKWNPTQEEIDYVIEKSRVYGIGSSSESRESA